MRLVQNEISNRERPSIAASGLRKILRCGNCNLVQYESSNHICRRCLKPMAASLPVKSLGQSGICNFGKIMQALRTWKGWSQEETASKFGSNHSYISKVESKGRIPGIGYCERLCVAFGISMKGLFSLVCNPVTDDPLILALFLETRGCLEEEKQAVLRVLEHTANRTQK